MYINPLVSIVHNLSSSYCTNRCFGRLFVLHPNANTFVRIPSTASIVQYLRTSGVTGVPETRAVPPGTQARPRLQKLLRILR